MTDLSDIYFMPIAAAEGEAMPKFTVTITFTAIASNEHLRDEKTIRDEAQSWFESLRANVLAVTVRRETSSPEQQKENKR
jgi:hypothetical protein